MHRRPAATWRGAQVICSSATRVCLVVSFPHRRTIDGDCGQILNRPNEPGMRSHDRGHRYAIESNELAYSVRLVIDSPDISFPTYICN